MELCGVVHVRFRCIRDTPSVDPMFDSICCMPAWWCTICKPLCLPSSDVSMLLRDPYALHCITHSLVRCLQDLAEKESLPRVRGVIVKGEGGVGGEGRSVMVSGKSEG